MLALAQNIAGLQDAATLLEEVIIVNNASQLDYAEVRKYIASVPSVNFKYIDAPENLGVARGRNYAIEMGKAPIMIMLDDDAEMGNPDCLHNLLKTFEADDNPRKTAVISFKVVYYETGQIQENAFPHKKFEKYKDRNSFLTYYYAGGAHAIRREIFEKLDRYPEDFFYGMEEYDLGYRIIDAGYAIRYTDSVTMLHKESPLGRKTKNEKQAMLWINKSKVAWRYLPFIYFLSTALMWSFEYLRKTGFDIVGWLRGWIEVFSIPAKENRKPVSASTLRYLKETEARLWY